MIVPKSCRNPSSQAEKPFDVDKVETHNFFRGSVRKIIDRAAFYPLGLQNMIFRGNLKLISFFLSPSYSLGKQTLEIEQKLALWNVVGVQGGPMSCAVQRPIRFSCMAYDRNLDDLTVVK